MLARGSRKAARELQKWCVRRILPALWGPILLEHAVTYILECSGSFTDDTWNVVTYSIQRRAAGFGSCCACRMRSSRFMPSIIP